MPILGVARGFARGEGHLGRLRMAVAEDHAETGSKAKVLMLHAAETRRPRGLKIGCACDPRFVMQTTCRIGIVWSRQRSSAGGTEPGCAHGEMRKVLHGTTRASGCRDLRTTCGRPERYTLCQFSQRTGRS